VTTPTILGRNHPPLPTADQVRSGDPGPNRLSFLQRYATLQRSIAEAFTGDRASCEQLLQPVEPADVIERGDTPAQVLILLELDSERRDQLQTIATPHEWHVPQPWEQYVWAHRDND
jgi:hypothetical protein